MKPEQLLKCLEMIDECLSHGVEITKDDLIHKTVVRLLREAKGEPIAQDEKLNTNEMFV
jgi:hypothetical protein